MQSSFTRDSLNLDADRTLSKDNGNLVGIRSSYETSDGQTRTMADVWFVADREDGVTEPVPVVDTLPAEPPTLLADAGGLQDAPGQAPTLELPKAEEPPKADPLAPTELRTKVSSLAAAIGEHSSQSSAEPDAFQRRSATAAPNGSQLASAPVALSAMVDVMSRFDANGQALGSKAPAAAPLSLNGSLDKKQDWLGQGVLGAFGNGS